MLRWISMIMAYALLVIFAVFSEGTLAQMTITACLNEELSINCTSDSNHVWEGTALDCASVIVAFNDQDGFMYPCGSTPIVKVEGGSRLMATADSSLDGATVVCKTFTESFVNATVEVLETIHTITNVMDVSDSCVELEVTTTSDPSLCFEEYTFSAVGVGNSATVDSSGGTVFTGMVCGLFCSPYCGYNYTVVGRPKYGEDVVAFKNADAECPQLESMDVDESEGSITLFLNDAIENMMCMNVTPNGLDYTINDTDGSVTWMGFSYCTQNYNLELEFECCPPVTGSYDTSIEILLAFEPEYQCSAGVVNAYATASATGIGIAPKVLLTVTNEAGLVFDPSNIEMDYMNYTVVVQASLDFCNNSAQYQFVPNIIVDHEVDEKYANISITYADCADTSDFMVKVEYKINGRDRDDVEANVIMPKQTLQLKLESGKRYDYLIEVISGANRIGDFVNGTFTTTTSSSGGLSGGAIAGIIIALVLIAIGIALVVVGVILYKHYNKVGTKGDRQRMGSSGEGGRTSEDEHKLDNLSKQ